MRLLTGALADPALEMALPLSMLRRASRGQVGETLRVYRPRRPTVAFGRRDTRLAGFPAAVEAARQAGFATVVRSPGGRVVAYTEASLVVDHISPGVFAPSGMNERFVLFGELFADALRTLGVDARLGEVPGEYCPGAYSVNAHGVSKLVGTAQRIVRDAWLFSSVMIMDDTARLRPLMKEVHDLLGLPFDGSSVGSIADEVDRSSDEIEAAVLAAYRTRGSLVPSSLDPEDLAAARDLVSDVRV